MNSRATAVTKEKPKSTSAQPRNNNIVARLSDKALQIARQTKETVVSIAKQFISTFEDIAKLSAEKRKPLLEQHRQSKEVLELKSDLEKMVADGYLSPDIAKQMIRKLKGQTGVFDRKDLHCFVGYKDARRAVNLLKEKFKNVTTPEQKAEMRLKARIAFSRGGVAGLLGVNTPSRDHSKTLFRAKVFDLNTTQLWREYAGFIQKLNDSSTSDILSSAKKHLSEDEYQKARTSLALEKKALRRLFEKQFKQREIDRNIASKTKVEALRRGGRKISTGSGMFDRFYVEANARDVMGFVNQHYQKLGLSGKINEEQARIIIGVLKMIRAGESSTHAGLRGYATKNSTSTAKGAYQFIDTTIASALRGKNGFLKPGESFPRWNTPQDRLRQDFAAIWMIGKVRGVLDEIVTQNVGKSAHVILKLSQEWAGLSKDGTNTSFYRGVGNNRANVKHADMYGQIYGRKPV